MREASSVSGDDLKWPQTKVATQHHVDCCQVECWPRTARTPHVFFREAGLSRYLCELSGNSFILLKKVITNED